MAQFDVVANPKRGRYPLLVDVQADLLRNLATRVVVPMVPRVEYGKPITRLNPTVTVDGVEYVMVFQELAAIPASALGKPLESLVGRRSDIVAAVDLLFTGF